MTKSTGLLAELRAIKVKLPETECFIPEWDRALRLRCLTVGEARALRRSADEESKGDTDAATMRLIAHSIVDENGARPLGNAEGVELLSRLSEATATCLIGALNRLYEGGAHEKNSDGMLGSDSSIASPGISTAQSLN